MTILLVWKLYVKRIRLEFFTGIRYYDTTTLETIRRTDETLVIHRLNIYDNITTLEDLTKTDETRILHLHKI